jgi:hypothetical protein
MFSIMSTTRRSNALPLTLLTGDSGVAVASSAAMAAVPVDVFGTVLEVAPKATEAKARAAAETNNILAGVSIEDRDVWAAEFRKIWGQLAWKSWDGHLYL